jgi:hypothetical protein
VALPRSLYDRRSCDPAEIAVATPSNAIHRPCPVLSRLHQDFHWLRHSNVY